MNALLVALVLTCAPDEKGATHANCAHPAATSAMSEQQQTSTPAAASNEALIARGEKLKGLPSVTLDKVLASPSQYDGKTVAIEAKVRKSCSRMGCWMELAASNNSPGVRVTMKDHGFFVPLDSAGRTAKVEGTVQVALLTPEKAEHFKSEGAQVAQDKDGSFREVQLVASGVELRK